MDTKTKWENYYFSHNCKNMRWGNTYYALLEKKDMFVIYELLIFYVNLGQLNKLSLYLINIREIRRGSQEWKILREKQTTFCTQDTGRRQTKQKQNKKHHIKLKRWTTHAPSKTGGEPRCSRRVSSSCLL